MTDKQKLKIAAAVAAALALAWLLFYPSERDRLDAEAKRLCAIDGGVKVYETVTLPAEKFDAGGYPRIPSGKPDADFSYFRIVAYEHLSGEMSAMNGPSLKRITTKYIRATDKKVLGELRQYSSGGGGWFSGYVHDYGYSCPANENIAVEEQKIFKKEGVK